MTARSTMADLITRLRLLINDARGAPQHLSDDELQDILDQNAQRFDQAELVPVETLDSATRAVEVLAYTATVGPWEASPLLQNAALETVTPAASDLLRGRWTLAASETPPVYITGAAYDLYGAAADALELLAARHLLGYDQLSDRYSRPRSENVEAIHRQAEVYRRLAWPRALTLRV